jgi:hypothetical protein
MRDTRGDKGHRCMKAEEAMSRSWQINGRRGVSRRVASPLRARLIFFLDTQYMDAALILRAARGPINLAPRGGNRTWRSANRPRNAIPRN